RDDIVASTAEDNVVTVPAIETIIPAIAVDSVVAGARDDDVIVCSAAKYNVVFSGVLEIVRVITWCAGIIADDQRRDLNAVDFDATGRIRSAIHAQARELLARIDLEGPRRRGEDGVRQMCHV